MASTGPGGPEQAPVGAGVGPREARLRAQWGPYLGPLVVVAIVVVAVLGGVLVAAVGAQGRPAGMSDVNSILGTLPVDPNAPPGGISALSSDPNAVTSTSSPPTTAAPSGPTTPVVDEFDRADASGDVGSTSDGRAWTVRSGTWAVRAGALQADSPERPAVVTVDAGDGRVRFGGTARRLVAGDGLVGRWTDGGDHLVLTAVPGVGGWRFQSIVGGAAVFTQQVPVTRTSDGVTIELEVDGSTVSVYADGKRTARFDVPAGALPAGTGYGFLAGGAPDDTSAWDRAVLEAP